MLVLVLWCTLSVHVSQHSFVSATSVLKVTYMKHTQALNHVPDSQNWIPIFPVNILISSSLCTTTGNLENLAKESAHAAMTKENQDQEDKPWSDRFVEVIAGVEVRNTHQCLVMVLLKQHCRFLSLHSSCTWNKKVWICSGVARVRAYTFTTLSHEMRLRVLAEGPLFRQISLQILISVYGCTAAVLIRLAKQETRRFMHKWQTVSLKWKTMSWITTMSARSGRTSTWVCLM